jgi:hypothetical protein
MLREDFAWGSIHEKDSFNKQEVADLHKKDLSSQKWSGFRVGEEFIVNVRNQGKTIELVKDGKSSKYKKLERVKDLMIIVADKNLDHFDSLEDDIEYSIKWFIDYMGRKDKDEMLYVLMLGSHNRSKEKGDNDDIQSGSGRQAMGESE